MTDNLSSEKKTAAKWFGDLRDRIVTTFEALEGSQTAGPSATLPAGRFEHAYRAQRREWQ